MFLVKKQAEEKYNLETERSLKLSPIQGTSNKLQQKTQLGGTSPGANGKPLSHVSGVRGRPATRRGRRGVHGRLSYASTSPAGATSLPTGWRVLQRLGVTSRAPPSLRDSGGCRGEAPGAQPEVAPVSEVTPPPAHPAHTRAFETSGHGRRRADSTWPDTGRGRRQSASMSPLPAPSPGVKGHHCAPELRPQTTVEA